MDAGIHNVRKTNGRKPKLQAISLAARTYKDEKQKRGRKVGQRKTTKQEDKVIMQTFHKKRPKGYGVDSRVVRDALPGKLRRSVSRRLVIRRLAEKGYTPQKKTHKSDFDEKTKKRRLAWCKKHQSKSSTQWTNQLQAVGDFWKTTWYPRELRSRFMRYRASWTYMRKAEKRQAAFQRPKKWFTAQQWKKTKQQKVFSLTASNGEQLTWLVPKGYTGAQWARDIRRKVAPWLRENFPNKRKFQILLDSEPVLHTDDAKEAMRDNGISTLPGWPMYSPDLNPQEHVWKWAEDELRRLEQRGDSFETFQKKLVKAVNKYKGAEKLVASMARKVKEVCDKNTGEMLED